MCRPARRTRRNRGGRPACALLCAAFALVAALGCRATPPALTPPQLAGLPRTGLDEGDAARRAIAHLHGREVAPLESAVAGYADGRLILFASRFADAGLANRAFGAMLERLASGTSPFSPPLELPDRPGTWLTRGPGGHHALWAAGTRVFWLQGDPALLDAGLRELAEPPG